MNIEFDDKELSAKILISRIRKIARYQKNLNSNSSLEFRRKLEKEYLYYWMLNQISMSVMEAEILDEEYKGEQVRTVMRGYINKNGETILKCIPDKINKESILESIPGNINKEDISNCIVGDFENEAILERIPGDIYKPVYIVGHEFFCEVAREVAFSFNMKRYGSACWETKNGCFILISVFPFKYD